MADDPLSAALAEIREREQAATKGPWWCDESDLVWRLHGVHMILPPFMEGFPEQVVNHQILKAPKTGTTYAEYWPSEADAAFIVGARSWVPMLLAAVDAVLKLTEPAREIDRDLDGNPEGPTTRVVRCDVIRGAIARELTGKAADDA